MVGYSSWSAAGLDGFSETFTFQFYFLPRSDEASTTMNMFWFFLVLHILAIWLRMARKVNDSAAAIGDFRLALCLRTVFDSGHKRQAELLGSDSAVRRLRRLPDSVAQALARNASLRRHSANRLCDHLGAR